MTLTISNNSERKINLVTIRSVIYHQFVAIFIQQFQSALYIFQSDTGMLIVIHFHFFCIKYRKLKIIFILPDPYPDFILMWIMRYMLKCIFNKWN